MDMLFTKPKTRKIIATHAKRAELEELIMKHQAVLENVEPVLIDGRSVKVWPGSDEELIGSARKLIKLKEEIGIPGAKNYVDELGAHVADGHLSRITGGQKGSKKIGQFQSRKTFWERQGRENIWPADEDPLRRKLSRAVGANEQHHIRVLETSRPFAMVEDGAGGLKLRDQAQLDRVAERLRKETDVFLGNQDRNEMFLSVKAHRTGKFGAHPTLIGLTDLQKGTQFQYNEETGQYEPEAFVNQPEDATTWNPEASTMTMDQQGNVTYGTDPYGIGDYTAGSGITGDPGPLGRPSFGGSPSPASPGTAAGAANIQAMAEAAQTNPQVLADIAAMTGTMPQQITTPTAPPSILSGGQGNQGGNFGGPSGHGSGMQGGQHGAAGGQGGQNTGTSRF